jgi:hypothetical protein
MTQRDKREEQKYYSHNVRVHKLNTQMTECIFPSTCLISETMRRFSIVLDVSSPHFDSYRTVIALHDVQIELYQC